MLILSELQRQRKKFITPTKGCHRCRIFHFKRGGHPAVGEAAEQGFDDVQLDEEAPHDGLEAERQPHVVLDQPK